MQKTSLDHLPVRHQRQLAEISAILQEEFDRAVAGGTQPYRRQGRIDKIVLFGSFARGDFVLDIAGPYVSDYDILVVVSHQRLTDPEFWGDAEDRLARMVKPYRPSVNFIVHTLAEVNHRLSEGHFFFSDIVEDGVLMFNRTGSKRFARAKKLSPEKALKVANEHYAERMPIADSFIDVAGYAQTKTNLYKIGAFQLHQATEHLFHCALLVLTNYTPATHNIEELRSLAENFTTDLRPVWPRDTRLARRNFQKIKRAYVEARYSPHYTITEEELRWSAVRVAMMRDVVARVCLERIAGLERDVGGDGGAPLPDHSSGID